jgi:tripartite-type tricarboxylate transporter receptor subunit TctC
MKNIKRYRQIWMAMGLAAVAMLAASGAWAQPKYPDRPIRVIVPFPPGGINDVVARPLLQKMGELLQGTMVIDNRAGAGGTIGATAAARAEGDGYTLLLGAASTMAVAPAMYTNPGYAPDKDFSSIGGMASVPSVLLTAKIEKFKRLQDMVSAAKAAPGTLNFGSAGAGASQHIQMELLKSRLGINLTHIPYKGGAPAMTDLLGGQIDFMLEPVPTAIPNVQAKKLAGLAISKAERAAALPDVPTFQEAGVADFMVTTWFGLFAPATLPPAVARQLEAALAKTVQDPMLAKSMRERGIDPMPMDASEFSRFAARERERWKAVVQQSGIKAD